MIGYTSALVKKHVDKHIESQLKKLPDVPGIYLYFNSSKELIYVGKATSLKDRVRSYFRGQRTSRPIEQLIHEVVDIEWKVTDSVLEAIILEANYIKKFQPKYNILGRDDKSWNYIVITKDVYPLVKTLRQHEVDNPTFHIADFKYMFGPYPGLNTKATMKLLRQIFYISDCYASAKATADKLRKPCFYRQLDQCLGVCTGEISPTEYRKKVILPLVQLLRGGKKRLISTLRTRMAGASKKQQYEEAGRLRNQIASLERIHDIALLNKSFVDNAIGMGTAGQVKRIEGYDISNLGATGKVGSMVVFNASGPVRSEYRKFKIKTVEGQSDVDCLEEVLVRRLRHDEWALPDVFLIDGGAPQVHRAKQVIHAVHPEAYIVGIAKGPERKKNEFFFGSRERGFVRWVDEHQDILIQVRDEAHRFAIAYQRKLRRLK